MLDEQDVKDRTPFRREWALGPCVPSFEDEVSALVDSRTRPSSRDALRRLANGGNRPATGPEPTDDPAVGAPAAEAGAATPQPAPADSIAAILAERGKTHGDFTDNARVMQSLKRIVHDEVGWDRLTDVQREALHMILHKVGRIISGNPNVHDHWDDIAGYAKLASERIA